MPSVFSASRPSGRSLTGLVHGPVDGTPILFIAGAGTGKSMVFGEDLLKICGIRLITMDRPGMGGSDPDLTRTPASTADDYRAFAAAVLGVTNPNLPIVANSQVAVFGLAAAAQGVGTKSCSGLSSRRSSQPVSASYFPRLRAISTIYRRANRTHIASSYV